MLDPETQRPIKEFIHGESSQRPSGMTKRVGVASPEGNRSEGAFKLSLDMGKVLHQSGSVTEWKVGGAKYACTALWPYVKSIIVIHHKKRGQTENPLLVLEEKHRQHQISPWLNPDLIEAVAQKTQTTPEVAALRLHYEFTGQQKKGDRRISATAGRFCRMLYKALVKKFSRQNQ